MAGLRVGCRPDQVLEEVSSVLRMLDKAYGVFGLTYKMALSTRPESYLGTLEQWDKAEASLKQALDSTGQPWEVCPHSAFMTAWNESPPTFWSPF